MTSDDRKRAFAQNNASIDQRDHLDRAFPTEYATVKQDIREARRDIKAFNKEIKDLRTGIRRQAAPANKMQGTGNVPREVEDQIRELKYRRDQTRTSTYERVQAQTQQASPADQVRMHDAAREELQKGMSKKARDKQNSPRLEPGTASVNRAQDRFFKKRAAGLSAPQNRDVAQPDMTDQGRLSQPVAGSPASVRFSMSLGYTKRAEQPKPEVRKEAPTSKTGNPSASDRFSHTFSLSKAKAAVNEPIKEQPDKTPATPTKGEGKEDI